MKIYNANKDERGYPIDMRDYLIDRGVSRGGTKGELLFEMKIWNFIARIVNKFKKKI